MTQPLRGIVQLTNSAALRFQNWSFTKKRRKTMPTKNPRVNIVVEPPLYKVMHDLATSVGVSMSTLARDLIREAIDLREDVALAGFADKRMKTFDRKKVLSHKDVWE
jgi:hypothetical protein